MVGGDRRLETGERHLGIPLGIDLGRRLENVRMVFKGVHEALAPLDCVRVGEIADEDQRMQLFARRLEFFLGEYSHLLDSETRDRLIVGDHDDALGHIGGRAVEGGDRHVRFLRQRNEHRLGIAVVSRQDDAVGALRNAVFDLLELAVGVLAAVQLDHLDAVFRERLDNRRVTGAPEAGRQILEGVADLLALGFRRCGHEKSAGAGKRQSRAGPTCKLHHSSSLPFSLRHLADPVLNFVRASPTGEIRREKVFRQARARFSFALSPRNLIAQTFYHVVMFTQSLSRA
jgi:hypothetical protein